MDKVNIINVKGFLLLSWILDCTYIYTSCLYTFNLFDKCSGIYRVVHFLLKLQMLVMVGYPIHLDHMLIQRQLKIFQTEEGLLDWINEVGEYATFNDG